MKKQVVARITRASAKETPPPPPPPPTLLGTLEKFSPELRNAVYSFLPDDGYKQIYHYKNLSFTHDKCESSKEPPHCYINKVIRQEMLNAGNADRYCRIRIDERALIANFAMHDVNDKTSTSPLKIPACKRLVITIDPPSPRFGSSFLHMRERIQALVAIINAGARSVNPQISIQLDRESGLQVTRQYNDFAILFGPFVELDSRCKAVMIFRTTGFDTFMPRVECYCGLIEAAMSFDADARLLLKSHQYQIDIRNIISRLQYKGLQPQATPSGGFILGLTGPPSQQTLPPPISPGSKISWPTLPGATARQTPMPNQMPMYPLSDIDTRTLKHAVAGILQCYERYEEHPPVWLTSLSRHLQYSTTATLVPRGVAEAALGGYTAHQMDLWAAGFIERENPFFDARELFDKKAGD